MHSDVNAFINLCAEKKRYDHIEQVAKLMKENQLNKARKYIQEHDDELPNPSLIKSVL